MSRVPRLDLVLAQRVVLVAVSFQFLVRSSYRVQLGKSCINCGIIWKRWLNKIDRVGGDLMRRF